MKKATSPSIMIVCNQFCCDEINRTLKIDSKIQLKVNYNAIVFDALAHIDLVAEAKTTANFCKKKI